MIPQDILNKYGMKTLDGYKEDFGDSIDTEIVFYKTFLVQTDYIDNKILEGIVYGKSPEELKSKYGDILEIREYCREQINRLEA